MKKIVPKLKKIFRKNQMIQKPLVATFLYNKKVARAFHDLTYYISNQDRIKNLTKIEDIKKEMATEKTAQVDEIFKKYVTKAETEEINIFRVLTKIRDKVILCIKNKQPLPIHDDLLSIIGNKYILLAAYRTIRKNKGSMTAAAPLPKKEYEQLDENQQKLMDKLYELPDGLDMDIIEEISILVKQDLYPWGYSRLIWVPKPGTTKQRPITIPPFADKMVQEAIRMVIEPIYEPVFQSMNCSFGFRASNGVHQAICSLSEPRNTSGLYKAIEGDIEQAYPNLDRKILLKVLSERIKDKKFLSFMEKRLHLRLFDTKDKKYQQTLLGIPQGGIDSPYLWNIYLLGFDKFIKEFIQEKFNKINQKVMTNKKGIKLKNPPINPLYNKADKEIIKTKERITLEKTQIKKLKTKSKDSYKGLFKEVKQLKLLQHKKRKIGYYDPNRKLLRFVYCRYADDWIIINNAPANINKQIKQAVSEWLLKERKALLSEKKTKITDMRVEPAHFLGFELKNETTRRLGYTKQGILKRTAGWRITIAPDRERLINRLYMKGYCDKHGFPREIPWISTLDTYTIIEKYNQVIQGFSNFYAEFVTYPSSLGRWIYIYQWSAIKTIAQKYKTNVAGVFKKYSKDVTCEVTCELPNKKILVKTKTLFNGSTIIPISLGLKIKRQIDKDLLEIERGNFIYYDDKNKQRTPRILDINFLDRINWINFRTQANLDLPCMACGNPESVMHHFTQVRKTVFTTIAPENSIMRMMYLRNRRQIPLCHECHMIKTHQGIYNGKTALKKLFDNRIANSEGYIIRGIPYEGAPLEERLKSKGWVEKQNLLLNNYEKRTG